MSNEDDVQVSGRTAFWSMMGILLTISFIATSCALKTEQVEPGHEMVLVDKPYIWGNQGVRPDPVTEGRVWLWESTEARFVSVVPAKYDEKFDDLSTANNNFIDYDSYLSLQVTDSVRIIKEFGDKWYVNNLKEQYRTIVRNATRRYAFDDILSNPGTSQLIEDEVRLELTKIIKSTKLPVIIIDMSLGRARPNLPVKNEMDATAAQQQRKKTLVSAQAAETQRAITEAARAKADNAYREAMNLDPEQFIRLQAVKEYSYACRFKSAQCYIFSDKVPVVAGK